MYAAEYVFCAGMRDMLADNCAAESKNCKDAQRACAGMEISMNQRTGNRRPPLRNEYIYGSAVPKIAVVPETEQRKRQPQPAVRKNREKAGHMNFGYVLFLVAAMCAAAFVLIHYIQLQADLTQKTKTVAAKQVELNNLKLANDEEYNRVVSSVNLEEIKRIAIGELGMTYAQEEQIVTYANEKNDYMRQVTKSEVSD